MKANSLSRMHSASQIEMPPSFLCVLCVFGGEFLDGSINFWSFRVSFIAKYLFDIRLHSILEID